MIRPQAVALASQIAFTELPPLSLYVHIPWCVKKCPYCDFNSHEVVGGGSHPEQRYLDALQSDLIQALPSIWGRSVQTVFIGGGTPSLFSGAAIEQLLAQIRALVRLAPNAEITMEANPGTFEAERFSAYRKAGVNRLSIGVQSFDDDLLKSIGRVHDGSQARAAIAYATEVFERINLDLMVALPRQTLEQCERDVETALSFGTEHLSLYHLTIEPNTYFAKFPPRLPDDDLAASMFDLITAKTQALGFEQYEVSAYAKPGARSRHNLNYWEFGDYLGIGAGAHSKISSANAITRQVRVRNPEQYMTQALGGEAVVQTEQVATASLAFEFMLNALRLKDGVASERFAQRTGVSGIAGSRAVSAAIQQAIDKGLMLDRLDRYAATELGWRFLNDLQELFLSHD
jgi:putative oxygen-independent coproporphyrinogen III oxidase